MTQPDPERPRLCVCGQMLALHEARHCTPFEDSERQQLTITDVIDELQRIRDEFGDLPVRTGGPEGDEVWSVWVTDLGPLSAVIG
ncbi:hypothetical protein SEA_PEPE_1 [Mycobacterium phage Pepe]|uniref:helicase n=1 Tax=Mycobacterium phage Pepe TaxID=1735466 RepID=UPI00070596DE|nr:helicase [Mycobacterium phage Pepe]ALK86975.1 hypothetical protein SEA_PEPE_1 [Mycobacterium phage Pepe]